jgi:AAA domain
MDSVFIPNALKARNQWLVWKLEDRGGPKPTKPPYCVKSGCLGKSNDPATWCDFNTALAALQNGKGYDGIGFAFAEGDGLTGIDVDHPWDSPIAVKIREQFQGTYCEKSPHGKLRIFCYGKPRRCGKGTTDKAIEVYDHTSPRYLTVTGEWIEGTAREVTNQQEALDWLHETYFKPKEEPKPKKPKASVPELSLGDQDIIDKAKVAKNGGKFCALFYGGWEAAGYLSQSEADAALCSMLAFWTQDEGQIDRIFRQSALMRPKWGKRHHADGRTYGMMTIEWALGAVTETNRPGLIEGGPPPWEDPPVESYANDPYAQGQGPEGTESEHTEEPSPGGASTERKPESRDGSTSFELTRLSELLAEPDEDTESVVDGLLPKSGFSVLVAKPKVGKSTLARNIALCVAKGESVLGKTVTQGGVIYLALEDKRAEVRRSFKAMEATGLKISGFMRLLRLSMRWRDCGRQ